MTGTETPDRSRRLADEHAALRRVATLVAEGATADELFVAVVEEVVQVLDVPAAWLWRYERDRSVTVLASVADPGFPVGTRWPLDGPSLSATILDTGRPARIDDYSALAGSIAAAARDSGFGSAFGAPITVDGTVWGLVCVGTRERQPLPVDTERRLAGFTELVATAISNAESRERLHRLADEQAALRRVATLVAEGATPGELFSAVAEEVAWMLDASAVSVARYEDDGSTVVVASFDDPSFPVGSRWPAEGPSLGAVVLETGRPARVDHTELDDPAAQAARASGINSGVGAPIVVDGTVWGMVAVGRRDRPEPMPPETEWRLAAFTELVATAISNAEARDRLLRLADEQAALHRVATLVAQAAPPEEVFAAVAEEVARLLLLPRVEMVRYGPGRVGTVIGASGDHPFPTGSQWTFDGPSIMESVARTGQPARIDNYGELPGTIAEIAHKAGFVSAIGVPIVIDGTTWGAIIAISTTPEPIPEGSESRLHLFTGLVATAVSNLEARDDLRSVVNEQTSLRRVATSAAGGAAAAELFAAVADEVSQVLEVPAVMLARYEPDRTITVLASVSAPSFSPGSRWPLDGPSVSATVLDTGLPARIDDFSELPGAIAAGVRDSGLTGVVGGPIIVDGKVWGVMTIGTRENEPMRAGADERLSAFTELLATAISNAESRDGLRLLANEQAALRRVATLVAEAATGAELFAAVAREAAEVLDNRVVHLVRFEPDRRITVLASENDPTFPVGSQWPLDGDSVSAAVFDGGRAARIDDYGQLRGSLAVATRTSGVTASAGVPIVVDGAVWGMLAVSATESEPLRPGIERHLQDFTELLATAISNTAAHDRIRQLADEQAALRRVATLVAEGTDAATVFDAVCAETGDLVGAAAVNLSHYTADGFNVTMAGWSLRDTHVPVGTRFPLTPDTLGGEIVRTQVPARVDDWEGATSELAKVVRERGIRSSLGAPVVVEGQLWGALVAATDGDEPLPAGTEFRLARFTELIATAISNATTRAELIASRARIVAAGDEARRRIERNLHDGTQQRLIALGLDLQRIRGTLADRPDANEGLGRVAEDLESVLEDVREVSRGLHPPLLSRGGLRPSLRALARRSPIPVDIDVELHERPSAAIETALYYVTSEALTNAIRHSQASAIWVTIRSDHAGGPFGVSIDGRRRDQRLHATIADDGVGGAEPTEGSGLAGLVDRIDALGGRLALDSPPGGGTRISIELPLTT